MVLGTGLGHFIPIVVYIGFWLFCIISLAWRPRYGLYYLIPFIPYRTMRDHFADYFLGENLFTILVVSVIIGAIIRGKRIPKLSLYLVWLVIGIYLYCSMWIGAAQGRSPAPLWLSNLNFVTWKDYMLIPIVFLAAGLVIEDRTSIRTVLLITALSVLFIDRSCILESMTRTWTSFDETKRSGGPLAFGSNQTAAYLAQCALFFWGFVQFVDKIKWRLAGYALVAITLFATMYTFSRAGYLAVLSGVLALGLLKQRKLLVLLVLFLATWQSVVPTAMRERVTMTTDSTGKLESSAQERIDLWKESWQLIVDNPVVGTGFATFQFMPHVDNLRDTHNWFIKVLVETGLIGMILVLALFQQTLALAYRLYKRAEDPIYRGLGLGLVVALTTSIIANLFGDRWTYLEITGPLWVLIAASARAIELANLRKTEDPALTRGVASTSYRVGFAEASLHPIRPLRPVRSQMIPTQEVLGR